MYRKFAISGNLWLLPFRYEGVDVSCRESHSTPIMIAFQELFCSVKRKLRIYDETNKDRRGKIMHRLNGDLIGSEAAGYVNGSVPLFKTVMRDRMKIEWKLT